jgi:cysteine-rich repeat protein
MLSSNTRFLACLALAACTPNNGGMGSAGESTDGSSTGTTTGTATTPLDTTADGTTAGSGGMSSSSDGGSTSSGGESSTTGPLCDPGDENCVCDEGACAEGLTCIKDECVVLLCGNGDVEAPEECDDANMVDSDGCDNDCTISAGAAQVIAGDEHVCALFHTGDIKCWGAFDSGRLGYMNQMQDVGNDETPADMPFVNVGDPVVQLALGSDFTCALLATDEVKCWGNGQHGRLGQGDQIDLGSDQEPADIPAIELGGTAAGGATTRASWGSRA